MADKLVVVYKPIVCCFLKTGCKAATLCFGILWYRPCTSAGVSVLCRKLRGRQTVLEHQCWVISCSSEWGNKKAGCFKVKRNSFWQSTVVEHQKSVIHMTPINWPKKLVKCSNEPWVLYCRSWDTLGFCYILLEHKTNRWKQHLPFLKTDYHLVLKVLLL